MTVLAHVDRSEARNLAIVLALEWGYLTEGQAAKLIGIDRLEMREWRDGVLKPVVEAFADEAWAKYRASRTVKD